MEIFPRPGWRPKKTVGGRLEKTYHWNVAGLSGTACERWPLPKTIDFAAIFGTAALAVSVNSGLFIPVAERRSLNSVESPRARCQERQPAATLPSFH